MGTSRRAFLTRLGRSKGFLIKETYRYEPSALYYNITTVLFCRGATFGLFLFVLLLQFLHHTCCVRKQQWR